MEREEERVNPITLTVGKDTYCLEFSRKTVTAAERNGFDIDEVAKYPMSKVYELFYWAFQMHHKGLPRSTTDRIIDDGFGGVGGIPEGMLEQLGKLYSVPFQAHEVDEGKKLQVSVEY